MTEHDYPEHAADETERRAEREIYEDLVEDMPEEAFTTEGAPPPEPTVRKGVAGTAAGTGALLILYLAEKWGLPMDMTLALAISGGVGALVAWAKREYA